MKRGGSAAGFFMRAPNNVGCACGRLDERARIGNVGAWFMALPRLGVGDAFRRLQNALLVTAVGSPFFFIGNPTSSLLFIMGAINAL